MSENWFTFLGVGLIILSVIFVALSSSKRVNLFGEREAGINFSFWVLVTGVAVIGFVITAVYSTNYNNSHNYVQQMTSWIEHETGVNAEETLVDELIAGRSVAIEVNDQNIVVSLQETDTNHVELIQRKQGEK